MNQGQWIRTAKNGLNVVFIHGINSSEECWRHENGSYWPKLLKDEGELADIGIYIFSYRTGLNTGFYSLSDIVDSLREYFRLDNLIGSSGIIFVCHSMGGIVTRRFLVNQQSDLIERDLKVGLFLVASPSLGSEYANMLNLISSATGHTQASALKFSQNNVWLNDLDKDFINLKNGKLQIEGKELIEDLPLYGKGFIRRQIVEPFSGAKYFGNSFKVPGSDHITIATPVNREAVQHRLLVQFISDFEDLFKANESNLVDEARTKKTTENLANLESNSDIVPELAVQQGEGYFVGGTNAVRRTALTLLDSTWDGDLVVHCGDIEAREAELRELESLAICSREQGDRNFRKLGSIPGIGLPISLNPTLKGYFETLTERDRLTTEMDEALTEWDAWLYPVAMTPAFTHRKRGAAIQVDDHNVPYSMASGAYVVPFNLTGHPAVVIPIGQTQNGLPIGMQIIGKRWRDMELLAIAQEIDQVVGRLQRPPGY